MKAPCEFITPEEYNRLLDCEVTENFTHTVSDRKFVKRGREYVVVALRLYDGSIITQDYLVRLVKVGGRQLLVSANLTNPRKPQPFAD